jgi:nucleoside-diphosphate-sugar epimerase
MNRLIFGCGYLGQCVARLWRDAGDTVYAVTRSDRRALELAAEGLTPLVADVTRPESLVVLAGLADLATVLFAVGYDRTAGPSIHQVYDEGFRLALDAAPPTARRVIYISTTGVYGPAGGAWVNEETHPNPVREGGRASLAAEGTLRASPYADRGVALRLAGIYGPGRIPFLKQLEAGEPIAAVESGWLNLIHVDDAAQVVAAAAAFENVSQLYCVSDGTPVVRGDFYREAAQRIGAALPSFIPPEPDSPRAARAAADKRISNTRMLSELRVRLKYEDYRQGLAAILGNGRASG